MRFRPNSSHAVSRLAALATLVVACDARAPDAVTRVDSAGWAIVTNGGDDARPLGWSADTVLALGGEEDGPEGFYHVRSALVDVDSAGRIYVLDDERRRVVVFDTAGSVLGSVGREGQGPGELEWPITLAVTPDGGILVQDAGKGLWARYDAELGYLGSTPYASPVIHTRFRHFAATPTGHVLWARDPRRGSAERFDRLLRVTGDDTLALVAGAPVRRSTAQYAECGMAYSIAIPLSPSIRWAQAGELTAVSLWGPYRVDLYREGRPERSVRKGAPPAPLSEAEAVALLHERGYQGPCNASPERVVERHGFHPDPPVVGALALGPDAELWVRHEPRTGDPRIDVFDGDGAFRGSLPADFPFPLTFLPDGRALVAARDSLDVERLLIVRIVR